MDNGKPTPDWQTLCQRTRLHAQATAANCSPSFVGLIDEEVRLFVSQPPPVSMEQLDALREQREQLDAKIALILHASVSAASAPDTATYILDAARRFCEKARLTEDCAAASRAVSYRIANLAAAASRVDAMKD